MTAVDRKVYVYDGSRDRGGSLLDTQVGMICHKKFGSSLFMVSNQIEKTKVKNHSRFKHSLDYPEIHMDEMLKTMEPSDLFICNSANATKWFGQNLPMKKLMHIQEVNNYPVLDIYYDHYVCVSHFVQKHIENIYNITPPIITPFIKDAIFQNKTSWKERKKALLVLDYNGYAGPVFQYLHKYYKRKYPFSSIQFKCVDNLSNEELADLFNQHKYFLTLNNPSEGFSFLPLEAMACGCAVVGFDSMGGRDYFQHEKNAYIVDYGDFDRLCDYLREIELGRDIGKNIAQQAVETAGEFSCNRFETQWTEYLKEHVYKV